MRTLSGAGVLIVGPEERGGRPDLDFERRDDDTLIALQSASVRHHIAVGPICPTQDAGRDSDLQRSPRNGVARL